MSVCTSCYTRFKVRTSSQGPEVVWMILDRSVYAERGKATLYPLPTRFLKELRCPLCGADSLDKFRPGKRRAAPFDMGATPRLALLKQRLRQLEADLDKNPGEPPAPSPAPSAPAGLREERERLLASLARSREDLDANRLSQEKFDDDASRRLGRVAEIEALLGE